MSLNSVNTNLGAMVALQSLNRTNEALNMTQKRVSTGYRVSDAKDDGAAFAVAQSVRADVAGLTAANEQLGGVKGVLDTALAGLRKVSDTMIKVRETLVRLADDTLNADQRAQYEFAVRGAAHADHQLPRGRDLQRPHAAHDHRAGRRRHHHHPQRGRHDLYPHRGGWRGHHDRRRRAHRCRRRAGRAGGGRGLGHDQHGHRQCAEPVRLRCALRRRADRLQPRQARCAGWRASAR